MTAIDGDSLAGVSATTLWTRRNRATEAKRPVEDDADRATVRGGFGQSSKLDDDAGREAGQSDLRS
jgi:hypothetical protein